MANRRSLTDKQRKRWEAELRLADEFDKHVMQPTAKYAEATKHNDALWTDLNWGSYDKVTANYLYANQQAVLPRVLLRNPKIVVKPAARMTAAFERSGQGDPAQQVVDRFVAAVAVKQVMDWRNREFDFLKQMRRMARDDYSRGIAFARHGYIAEGDKTLQRGGRQFEFVTHKHLREGWPYAVHQPLDYTRWDQKARDVDEREWVAFGKLWLPEDLKSYYGLRREIKGTRIIGKDWNKSLTWQEELQRKYLDELGYACVWEVWDRRDGQVIHWLEDANEEIRVEDWPIDVEGLPDTVLCSNESNERIEPVPETQMVWELNQELNQLISMLLVYAKRGVSVIGYDKGQLSDESVKLVEDAEILEMIETKGGDVMKAIGVLKLDSVPQTLIVAIQTVQNLIREVGSVAAFGRGTRENVDTAAEVQEIGQGGDLRQAMRADAVRNAYAELIRKDHQILRQTVTVEQIVDVSVEAGMVLQMRVTPKQLQMEYDFEIAAGSTEPLNENTERIKAVAFVTAMMGDPELRRHTNPRQFAEMVCRAFGYDEHEVLADMNAAQQQSLADALTAQLGGQGTPGAQNAAQSMTPGAKGASELLKSRGDNKDAARMQ